MQSPEEYAERYRDNLKETLEALRDMEQMIFLKIVNLAMSNELREIDEVFENGDEHYFELSHFEDSTDVNVNKLIGLLKKITATKNSVANINAINFDEDEDAVQQGEETGNPDSFAENLDGEQRLMYDLIDRILWVVWDPLGINNIAGSEIAYSMYCPEIYHLKKSKVSVDEIASFLYESEQNINGIQENYDACKKVASIIHSL